MNTGDGISHVIVGQIDQMVRTRRALDAIAEAEQRTLILALAVLTARRGAPMSRTDDLIAYTAKEIANLAMNAPDELIAELESARERFGAFTADGAELPPAPAIGQLWWVHDPREYGSADQGFLVVEDIEATPLTVIFLEDNAFDLYSVAWSNIATPPDGSSYAFKYIGLAPAELRDAYERPTSPA